METLGTLAAECKLLLSTINAVLEPSQLLKLPEELLQRILSHCDATALGSLESVSHLFRNGLVDQAVDHAAVVQHGEKLAALRPQRLSAARRLWCLEQAVKSGRGFVSNAAYQVANEGFTFVWPEANPFTARDVGAHALAVVLAASSGPTPPQEAVPMRH